jgi:hypothetical protein
MMPAAASFPMQSTVGHDPQAPAFQDHNMIQHGQRMMHPMATTMHGSRMNYSNMGPSSHPYPMIPPMAPTASFASQPSANSPTNVPGSTPGASELPPPSNRMHMQQGTVPMSNYPSMQAPMHAYMSDMPPHYSNMNMGPVFYPSHHQQPSSYMNRGYSSYPITLSRSEERQASLTRSQQLRIMLAEEEERQASISRTQQLRAMLDEEERRLGYLMNREHRYDYGYMYNPVEQQQHFGYEHGGGHQQQQHAPYEQGGQQQYSSGQGAAPSQNDEPKEGHSLNTNPKNHSN